MALFIWTTKIDRRKIALVLTVAVLGILAVIAVLCGGRIAAASAAVSPKGVRTAEDRIAYLAGWGWEAVESDTPVEELELPRTFGPEYDQYLQLQLDQGFDLTRCAGKRVRRYTFDLRNDPSGAEGVQAHLLIRRNRVVGGEVLGPDFLRGLARPEDGI